VPYKKVIAIGDSFTRGDELDDCPPSFSEDPFVHSKQTWPAIIAQGLGIEYECISLGGRGNHWISSVLSDKLYSNDNILFIINWSWFERFDYIDNESKTVQWKTTHPRHEDRLNHFFYKHIDNELWNLHRNLQQIHSTICLLQQNKKKFIMTCIDPMLYMKYKPFKPLQDQTNHYIINFWGYTFLEWSKQKGFPIGPGGHPLEKAHTEAANYINMVTTEGRKNGH